MFSCSRHASTAAKLRHILNCMLMNFVVGFEVITAAIMESFLFWDITQSLLCLMPALCWLILGP
jgi:hypothetical protein